MLMCGGQSDCGTMSHLRGRAEASGGTQGDRGAQAWAAAAWGHDEFLMKGLAMVKEEGSLSAAACNVRHMPELLAGGNRHDLQRAPALRVGGGVRRAEQADGLDAADLRHFNIGEHEIEDRGAKLRHGDGHALR